MNFLLRENSSQSRFMKPHPILNTCDYLCLSLSLVLYSPEKNLENVLIVKYK